MPRKYVRKRVAAYNDSDLQSALSEVEKGKTIHEMASKYNIPRETLRRWATGIPSRKGSGRLTVLSKEEELSIVGTLQFLTQCGFSFDRQTIIQIAGEYIKSNRKNNYCSLGIDWARNFERRWASQFENWKPELTKSKSNNLSQNVIDNFFNMYLDVLTKNNLLNSPDRIFNFYEVGLETDPCAGKMLVERCTRNAYIKSPGTGKAIYSVLFCISADGNYLPPFTIYKSAHKNNTGGPSGARFGYTASGWMQDDIFESWIMNFAEHIETLNKPVLLLFNGHGSHLTYKSIETAIKKKILILCVPPNICHALQSLDIGVFAPIKHTWQLIMKNWYSGARLQKVTNNMFPCLLKKVYQELKKEQAIKGFEEAGLYPVNKEIVEKRLLETQMLHPQELLTTSTITHANPDSNVPDIREQSSLRPSSTMSREIHNPLHNNRRKRKCPQHILRDKLREEVESLRKEVQLLVKLKKFKDE